MILDRTAVLRQFRPALGGACSLLIAAIPGPCCSFNDLSVPEEAGLADEPAPSEDAQQTEPEAAAEADQTLESGPVCTASQVDCDQDPTNGCEANLDQEGAHCGSCEHSCLGGLCQAGQCQPVVLAEAQDSPAGIAIDSNYVYWTNYVTGGSVLRIPRTGGIPEPIAQEHEHPTGIAVDSEAIYWVTYTSQDLGGVWKLKRSDIGKGGLEVELATGETAAVCIALDDTFVYWTTPTAIRRIPKAGGVPVSLVANQPTPGGLAVDLSGIYFTNITGNTVSHINFGLDPIVTVLASGQSGPSGLALDNANLYWTNQLGDPAAGGQSVVAMPKYNGSPRTVAVNQNSPLGIAEFGSDLFWTNNVGASVARTSKTNDAAAGVQVLATNQSGALAIVVDATYIFWTAQKDGKVMRLAR